MVWQQWAFLVWGLLSILGTIALIGKPKVPTTPGMAIVSVIMTGLLIWLVLSI